MTLLANGAVGRSSDFRLEPLEACTQAIREHTEYPVGLPSPHYLCARNCRVELVCCVDKIALFWSTIRMLNFTCSALNRLGACSMGCN